MTEQVGTSPGGVVGGGGKSPSPTKGNNVLTAAAMLAPITTTDITNTQSTCAEFAKNFAALEIRFNQQHELLTAEQQKNQRLTIINQDLNALMAEKDEVMEKLQESIKAASQHKGRAIQAATALEHLKGRVEGMKKALSDKDMEHAHQTDQLRSQIKDLLQRIEQNADHPTLAAARNQSTEMEERCAIMSGQLTAEREKAMHSQMQAVVTVRDLSAKNLEMEQRVRGLDSEVTQLRGQLKGAADAQHSAESDCERIKIDNQGLKTQVAALHQELTSLRQLVEERGDAHQTAIQQREGEWERERGRLRALADAAEERCQDAASRRIEDADKLTAASKASQQQLQSMQKEFQRDLQLSHDDAHEAREETIRAKAKMNSVQLELEAALAEQQRLETRAIHAEALNTQLQSKIDGAAQNEAWLSGEKERLEQAVQASTTRAEELATGMRESDRLTLEIERVKIQLQYSQQEIAEAQNAAQAERDGAKQLHQAWQHKLRQEKALRKDLARAFKSQQLKESKQKHILLQALLEKEETLGSAIPSALLHTTLGAADNKGEAAIAANALADITNFSNSRGGLNSSGAKHNNSRTSHQQQQQPNAIQLLTSQIEAAQTFQQQLTELQSRIT